MTQDSIFDQARQLSKEERSAFLQRTCSDPVQRSLIEEKLKNEESSPDLSGGSSEHTLTFDSSSGSGTHPGISVSETKGTLIGGRYILVDPIGEGGMGRVWRANQTEPVKRTVAIKFIKAGMDSKRVLARFESERQALAVMDNPNIARVLDGGLHDGRPFFVMELVEGVPITQFCDERRYTPSQRLALFIQACHAIQHAHQKGIIHRDIKPSNVLVALNDEKPCVKVIDFGVAKATTGDLTDSTLDTAFGAVVGTPQYMSPEQAALSNIDIDTRTDVYALGVLLYELLTGSPPFSRKDLEKQGMLEVLRVVREEDPQRPSTKLSSSKTLPSISANRGTEPKKLTGILRNELDWIVMKALEKDRARRYDTANGFAADVLRYLNGEPVTAHPPSRFYRFGKFVRRNRAQVFAASLTLLALILGMVGTTIGLVEARRQAEIAKIKEDEAITAAEREAGQRREAELAREEESNQRKQAQAKEAEANGVIRFFEENVFAAARPKGRGGLGKDVSLYTAILGSLKALDKAFPDQPEIEARLRKSLGGTFQFLGEYSAAKDQFQRAVEIYQTQHGSEGLETLRAKNLLATTLHQLDLYADALKLREEASAALKKTLGAEHPETLNSINNLANSFSTLGRIGDALQLRLENLESFQKTLGREHPNTLRAMNNVANSLADHDRHNEAIPIFEKTLVLRERVLGREHPETLQTLHSMAKSHVELDRFQEAAPLFDRVLAGRQKMLGTDHPDTLATKSRLAKCLFELGRENEALELRQSILASEKRIHPPDHPDVLSGLRAVAESLIRLKRGQEALPLIEECVELGKGKPAHHRTVTAVIELRLRHYAQVQDPNGCRDTAKVFEGLQRQDSRSLYAAARFRSVTAQIQRKTPGELSEKLAREDADRAMKWLEMAVQAGYKNHTKMIEDPDLQELSLRADFQKLCANLEKKLR